MAATSLIASAAGGAMSTVGSYYAARGQKSSLQFQARIDEINAQMADASARDVLRRGERQEQSQRMSTAQLRSRQRAVMGASGVDLGSETAAAILTSTDYLGEMDANEIKANAMRDAFGLRMDAGNYRASASMNRATSKAINPLMQATGTFLTAAAGYGADYTSFKDSGALGESKARWSKIGGKAKGLAGY